MKRVEHTKMYSTQLTDNLTLSPILASNSLVLQFRHPPISFPWWDIAIATFYRLAVNSTARFGWTDIPHTLHMTMNNIENGECFHRFKWVRVFSHQLRSRPWIWIKNADTPFFLKQTITLSRTDTPTRKALSPSCFPVGFSWPVRLGHVSNVRLSSTCVHRETPIRP